MRSMHRLLAGVVMVGLVSAGCGYGATSPEASRSATEASRSGTDVAGGPLEGRGRTSVPDVATAPISIPPIFDLQGIDIDTVRQSVESRIRAACGDGTLCVTVVVAAGTDPGFSTCAYVTSDPRSHSDATTFVLARGSTLTLLTGSEECPPSEGTDDGVGTEPEVSAPETAESDESEESTYSIPAGEEPVSTG